VTTSGDETALIIPVRLPPPLEILRQRGVPEARRGLPAHATLLYPFAPPEALVDELLARVAAIVASHDCFPFRLAARRHWPDTLYVSLEPELPFRALHEDLARAFPAFPLYRGAFGFVPHATIAEGSAVAAPELVDDPAWELLPAVGVACVVDLVVQAGGGWRTRSRFDLRATGTGG
jgi:2'-5' RNA ligase